MKEVDGERITKSSPKQVKDKSAVKSAASHKPVKSGVTSSVSKTSVKPVKAKDKPVEQKASTSKVKTIDKSAKSSPKSKLKSVKNVKAGLIKSKITKVKDLKVAKGKVLDAKLKTKQSIAAKLASKKSMARVLHLQSSKRTLSKPKTLQNRSRKSKAGKLQIKMASFKLPTRKAEKRKESNSKGSLSDVKDKSEDVLVGIHSYLESSCFLSLL